jgi:hypothetical protein
MTTTATEITVLDERTTVRLLDEALAKRGEDFVYDRVSYGDQCVYVYDGQPACLVGEVLFLAGVPVEWMEYNNSGNADDILGKLESQRGVQVPQAVKDALRSAQSQQDKGQPWDKSVKAARSRIAESILFPSY